MLSVKVFTFNPVAENTYVVSNEHKQALIIDPGCYFSEEKRELQTYLETNELKPVQLLNTHCHLDHVFGNKWVHETYGLELFIHPNEEIVLKYAPQSGKTWGMEFDNYEGNLHFLYARDKVELGNDVLKVLFTPGHSPGSICFYCAEQGFVIGGDVLFRQSIGRTDLPGGDYETLLTSIRDELMTLPPDTVIYPGHGEQTTIGYEKKHNPFLKVEG